MERNNSTLLIETERMDAFLEGLAEKRSDLAHDIHSEILGEISKLHHLLSADADLQELSRRLKKVSQAGRKIEQRAYPLIVKHIGLLAALESMFETALDEEAFADLSIRQSFKSKASCSIPSVLAVEFYEMVRDYFELLLKEAGARKISVSGTEDSQLISVKIIADAALESKCLSPLECRAFLAKLNLQADCQGEESTLKLSFDAS